MKNKDTLETAAEVLPAEEHRAEEEKLRLSECPVCSYPLMLHMEQVIAQCPCCGNLVNVMDKRVSNDAQKVSGIKTASAAKAYMEYVLDSYDWEKFGENPSAITIPEVDALLESLKVTAGDDKETWTLCFDYTCKCVEEKIKHMKRVLDDTVKKYLTGADFDECHNVYDCVKEGGVSLKTNKEKLVSTLTNYITYAQKVGLGVSKEVSDEMQSRLGAISASIDKMELAPSFDKHPIYIEQEKKKMALLQKSYADQGVDAQSIYEAAVSCYEKHDADGAVKGFGRIPEYLDSKKYLALLDKITVLSNKYYYFNNKVYFTNGFNPDCLHFSKDKMAEYGVEQSKPFDQFLGYYGDKFYYIDPADASKYYIMFLEGAKVSNFKKRLFRKPKLIAKYVEAYGKTKFEGKLETSPSTAILTVEYEPVLDVDKKKAFLQEQHLKSGMSVNHNVVYPDWHDVLSLDLKTSSFKVLVEGVKAIADIVKDDIYYTAPAPVSNKKGAVIKYEGSALYRYNVTTESKQQLVAPKDFALYDGCAVLHIDEDGTVVFSCNNHGLSNTEGNIDIFVVKNAESGAVKVAQNAYKFFRMINGKIFYLVGNEHVKSLCSVNADGTGYTEVMKYMDEIAFTLGSWIYVTRGDNKEGYRTLFRVNENGGEAEKVAFGVNEGDLAEGRRITHEGYLYYTDYMHSLCRVRLDGTGAQSLMRGVHKIILIRYGKIFYTGFDEEGGERITSLYCMNMDGSERRKLIFRVKDIKEQDDGHLIYVCEERFATKRDLYDGIADKKLQKRINRYYKKYDKWNCYPASVFDTIELFDCEKEDSTILAYDTWYPTKKSLKEEKRAVKLEFYRSKLEPQLQTRIREIIRSYDKTGTFTRASFDHISLYDKKTAGAGVHSHGGYYLTGRQLRAGKKAIRKMMKTILSDFERQVKAAQETKTEKNAKKK